MVGSIKPSGELVRRWPGEFCLGMRGSMSMKAIEGVGCPCGTPGIICCWKATLAWVARAAALEARLAKRAAHGSPFSAHLEQGTLLSQPVFALAQFWQAMGVRPAIVGIQPGKGSIGSRIS